ncbi:uncharacterized protein LOC114801647 isoform X2 [Denticeps clupeoides]|uniref:uncharacterized protein LOC114801647 isoform X2 n=1 Tax=Denticeps clupeoides TaxID=299321 RepID=UPI0010A552D9|nr:uncharacterized protein LOC114801647 isoform X2 [Denticeps clupeoides]
MVPFTSTSSPVFISSPKGAWDSSGGGQRFRDGFTGATDGPCGRNKSADSAGLKRGLDVTCDLCFIAGWNSGAWPGAARRLGISVCLWFLWAGAVQYLRMRLTGASADVQEVNGRKRRMQRFRQRMQITVQLVSSLADSRCFGLKSPRIRATSRTSCSNLSHVPCVCLQAAQEMIALHQLLTLVLPSCLQLRRCSSSPASHTPSHACSSGDVPPHQLLTLLVMPAAQEMFLLTSFSHSSSCLQLRRCSSSPASHTPSHACSSGDVPPHQLLTLLVMPAAQEMFLLTSFSQFSSCLQLRRCSSSPAPHTSRHACSSGDVPPHQLLTLLVMPAAQEMFLLTSFSHS